MRRKHPKGSTASAIVASSTAGSSPAVIGRRRALSRLGLSVVAVYAAPALISLRGATAQSGAGGSGGGSGGGGGRRGTGGGAGDAGGGTTGGGTDAGGTTTGSGGDAVDETTDDTTAPLVGGIGVGGGDDLPL